MLLIFLITFYVQGNLAAQFAAMVTNAIIDAAQGDNRGPCDHPRANCCKYWSLYNKQPLGDWGSTPESEKSWYISNDCDTVMGGKYAPNCPYLCEIHGCTDCAYFKLVDAGATRCGSPHGRYGTCNKCTGDCSGKSMQFDTNIRPRCDTCPPQCRKAEKCDKCEGGLCSYSSLCSFNYYETSNTCNGPDNGDCPYCQNGSTCSGGKCLCGSSFEGRFCEREKRVCACTGKSEWADEDGRLEAHCSAKSESDCGGPCVMSCVEESEETSLNAELKETNAALLRVLEKLQ